MADPNEEETDLSRRDDDEGKGAGTENAGDPQLNDDGDTTVTEGDEDLGGGEANEHDIEDEHLGDEDDLDPGAEEAEDKSDLGAGETEERAEEQ